MNKIKNLVIDHVEKLVLVIFVCGGVFHLFNTLKPQENINSKDVLTKLKERVIASQQTATPPTLPVPVYFNQMRAPFERVPSIEAPNTWRWYQIPNVSDRVTVKEDSKTDLRLSFVTNIDRIQILEGKDVADIKIKSEATLEVTSKKVGKAVFVCYAPNGTKETWTVKVIAQVKIVTLDRQAWPPQKIDPVAERGTIKVHVQRNPLNFDTKKALPFLGYNVYRRTGKEGEWTKIHFEPAAKPEVEKVEERPAKTEDALPSIPSIPGLPQGQPATGNDTGKDDNSTKISGFAKKNRESGKPKKKKEMPSGEEATDEEGADKLVEKRKDWFVYADDDVKPDTTYYYSATTLAKAVSGDVVLDDEEPIESDKKKCLSDEVVSKSNVEIFLVGSFNHAANVKVRKWSNDAEFQEKLFIVPVGDSIGTAQRVRVGSNWEQVDFATGSILVDIVGEVRDRTFEKRLVPVLDKNGRAVMVNNRLVREEISIPKLLLTPKIIVLDGKGRIREYLRK